MKCLHCLLPRLILEREGGHHEVLNPRDLALLIFLESLQELCFEVLPDHQVLLALLLAEFLDRYGDVAFVEVGDDTHLL